MLCSKFVQMDGLIVYMPCLVEISKLLSAPLGKLCGLPFGQIWISFTQGCFVPSLVEIKDLF